MPDNACYAPLCRDFSFPHRGQAFVRDQGVVLVSAKGPVPRLVDFMLGPTLLAATAVGAVRR